MIIKNPKSSTFKWLKRGALTIFVVEAVCFAGSYGIWYKLNTERESRRYLRDKFPFGLELYYKTGELLDSSSNVRQVDQVYWDNN